MVRKQLEEGQMFNLCSVWSVSRLAKLSNLLLFKTRLAVVHVIFEHIISFNAPDMTNTWMHLRPVDCLQGWYDSLRAELGPCGVSFLLLCPGPVFSGIQKASFTGKVGKVSSFTIKS